MMRSFAAVTILSLVSSPVFARRPPTALQSSATSITVGASITLTATVAGASGAAVPTGTVEFQLGTSSLGTESLDGSGVATLTTTSLPAGSDAITATYNGDANYNASTSPALTITVVAPQPDFAVTDNPATIEVTDGSSGTTTLTVAPAYGFNGTISFACSGLPSKATCSFSPPSVTLNGNTATTRLTIVAAASTTGVAVNHGPARHDSRLKSELTVSGLMAGLLFLGSIRRSRGTLCLLVLFVLSGSVLGCGSSGVYKTTIPGTPPGTYSVTVTASSSAVSHSTKINLMVQ